MSAELAAVLKSKAGAAVPLAGVQAAGRLTGLVFELAVEQSYRNKGAVNIEAEYTFPVPHRAVLLGLELQIGERALQAVAVRRDQAREDYEEAIDDGDSAALLEQSGDGLYTLSLGNLMAGETAKIRYRYAELLDRTGDEVRLAIPTVIAPRYGDPSAHGLAPHQAPTADLFASYPFVLEVDVLGEIAAAALHSPSHSIEVKRIEGGRRVRLGVGAMLDRDFVLTVTGPQTRAASLVAPDMLAGADGARTVALVSIDPQIAEPAAAPLALKLVVDCSGSMGGDSIGCARRALTAILDRLDAGDGVSVTRFGSTFEHLAPGGEAWRPRVAGATDLFGEQPGPVTAIGRLRDFLGGASSRSRPSTPRSSGQGMLTAATPEIVERLRHDVRNLQADLGGTELTGALQAALAIPAEGAWTKDILLITDAEVWAVEATLDAVARAGHRLFVVVVGSAPAEALARQLAERTGGACEFVGPNEDAEAAIVRTFRRMREAPKRVARVEWPSRPVWEAPLPVAVFSGDTLHLIAGFDECPVGVARVFVAGPDGRETVLESALPPVATNETLPRLAAAKRLASLQDEQAAALAERYQLASRHTSFVVVQVRDAEGKAKELPKLHTVPQMLAAGWGGVGRVDVNDLACLSANLSPPLLKSVFMRRGPDVAEASWSYDAGLSARDNLSRYGRGDDEIRVADARERIAGLAVPPERSPGEVLREIADRLAAGLPGPVDLQGLVAVGVPLSVIEILISILNDSQSVTDGEARLVRLWIALLARSPAGDVLGDTERKALKGNVLAGREDRAWRSLLSAIFDRVTPDAWTARVTEDVP